MAFDELLGAGGASPDAALAEEGSDQPPRRIKTEKQDVPVETLHNWVRRGKLVLQPDFQRNWVWDALKASRLIESLLLDIPIPVIYVAEESDKSLVVVDGQQRLQSICGFINGRFPDGGDFRLCKLRVLPEYTGQSFEQLPAQAKEVILGSTLRLIVITRDSEPQVKFEVFERLNQDAIALNHQELRNCLYQGPYNDLIRDLANNPHLRKILEIDRPHKRMLDRSLVLRFLALWHCPPLQYRVRMTQLLNQDMAAHRYASEAERAQLRQVFERTVELVWNLFDRNACRRLLIGQEGKPDGYRDKPNLAMWDTLVCVLSGFQKRQLIPIADAVREEFLDLMTHDERFIQCLTSDATAPRRLRYRAEAWRQRLQALVDQADPGPRCFSRALKVELYKANPTCALCGQHIHELDDAEVDHIQHYWRGGKTIPTNARLAHRFCNRSRGRRP